MKSVIYTKSGCPFCKKALSLLESKNIPVEHADVTHDPDLRQRISKENNDWPTVPMIFINDVFIGGYTDLVKLLNEKGSHAQCCGGSCKL